MGWNNVMCVPGIRTPSQYLDILSSGSGQLTPFPSALFVTFKSPSVFVDAVRCPRAAKSVTASTQVLAI